jgi:hypothetical protein
MPKLVRCYGCGSYFPSRRNPGGRKNQSRILVNCDDCRARRKRYVDELYLRRSGKKKSEGGILWKKIPWFAK